MSDKPTPPSAAPSGGATAQHTKHGDFVWYDLMCSDAEAARAFYGPLLGWTFDDKYDDYTTFSAGIELIGGLLPITEEMASKGAKPCWLGYLKVDNVDASAKSIESAGGTVFRQPWDIEGVGRAAFVTDPQGSMFYIITMAQPEEGGQRACSVEEPLIGHCAWNELETSDQEGAVEFYGREFGWTEHTEMPMGPDAVYKLLAHRGQMIAGVLAKSAAMPMSVWSYYFRVQDIDGAAELVKANGGKVLHGPAEAPGQDWMLRGQDPEGAYFALVGKRS